MAVSESTLIEAGIQIGLLKQDQLKELRLEAKRERLRLLEVVTRSGRFPLEALYQALADLRGIPFFQPGQLQPDKEALAKLPRTARQKRPLLPLLQEDGTRIAVLGDPDDRMSVERIERLTGHSYKIGLADPEALQSALELNDAAGPAAMQAEEGADPVELLDEIMKEVYLRRATDVHFEPGEHGMRIRMRVDGQMQEYGKMLNHADEEALMNRIKVLAGLDIAEQRMAQDGAMNYAIHGWQNAADTDIRVATIPTKWGERGTLRILAQDTGNFTLEDLGMPEDMLAEFRRAITSPYGMILVTGPTGSGKSTTLYSAIRELDIGAVNVLTVEDPVEQPIAGISQVQVSGKVSFAQALRSFLRHDPDVILVGEIRDGETVEIGLRAAMTGHLVLSTLHTNDAVGAVTRLADIGAERFLIGSTLIGVLAQRLVRKLCVHCRREYTADEEELALLGIEPGREVTLYGPGGCSFCLGSGFRGRIGIFEALWIDRELGHAIAEGAGESEIHDRARGLRTLWQDSRDKVLQGKVPLREVLHLRQEA